MLGGRVDISYQKTGEKIKIAVADTVQGMTIDQTKNILKLGQKTSTISTAGEIVTGLGLALCQDMLTRNNDRIWVTSKQNVGSHFISHCRKNRKILF